MEAELPSFLSCSVLNQLYTKDAYMSYNFRLVMSLPAMSLGLSFCTSRKGETGPQGRWASFNTGPR